MAKRKKQNQEQQNQEQEQPRLTGTELRDMGMDLIADTKFPEMLLDQTLQPLLVVNDNGEVEFTDVVFIGHGIANELVDDVNLDIKKSFFDLTPMEAGARIVLQNRLYQMVEELLDKEGRHTTTDDETGEEVNTEFHVMIKPVIELLLHAPEIAELCWTSCELGESGKPPPVPNMIKAILNTRVGMNLFLAGRQGMSLINFLASKILVSSCITSAGAEGEELTFSPTRKRWCSLVESDSVHSTVEGFIRAANEGTTFTKKEYQDRVDEIVEKVEKLAGESGMRAFKYDIQRSQRFIRASLIGPRMRGVIPLRDQHNLGLAGIKRVIKEFKKDPKDQMPIAVEITGIDSNTGRPYPKPSYFFLKGRKEDGLVADLFHIGSYRKASQFLLDAGSRQTFDDEADLFSKDTSEDKKELFWLEVARHDGSRLIQFTTEELEKYPECVRVRYAPEVFDPAIVIEGMQPISHRDHPPTDNPEVQAQEQDEPQIEEPQPKSDRKAKLDELLSMGRNNRSNGNGRSKKKARRSNGNGRHPPTAAGRAMTDAETRRATESNSEQGKSYRP